MDYQRVEGDRERVARLEHGRDWRARTGASERSDGRLERDRDGITDPDHRPL